MSTDFLRTLRDGARHLRDVYADVKAVVFSRRGHEETVFARRTLGDGVPIEPWYLADYFLQQWSDWSGLRARFVRYFGEPERGLPATWAKLDQDCNMLAQQVAADDDFCRRIEDHWFTSFESGRNGYDELDAAVRQSYMSIVQNYRRWTVASMADEELDQSAPAKRPSQPTEKVESEVDLRRKNQLRPISDSWRRLSEAANKLNLVAIQVWQDTPGEVRREVHTFVRNYCHASVIYSWLYGKAVLDAFPNWPALLTIQLSGKAMSPTIEGFLDRIDNADTRGTTKHVVERLNSAVAEVGFANVFEDITSGQFQGGADSPIGSYQINLIPSDIMGPCQAVLLAVSRGDKKAAGFPAVMRKVREHLIRCPITKSVIVVCDYWTPTMLDEHLGDLRAHHARGVQFLFLMAGIPDRVMSPVGVELA